jgi:hypothetical protein
MSDEALFAVEQAAPARPGNVLASFRKAVAAGRAAGTIVAEDEALIAGTEVMCRALDAADRTGGLKGGYLAAQAFPPYQRALHALRLPAELTAATGAATGTESQTGTPDWLSDTSVPRSSDRGFRPGSPPPAIRDRRTVGPKVGLVARALGMPLMPWQQYVADVGGEVDDAGRFATRC